MVNSKAITNLKKEERGTIRLFAPKIKPKASDWAMKNFYLSPEYSDPESATLYDGTEFPYQREPLDVITGDEYEDVTLCFGTQLGKTLMIMIAMGYWIEFEPSGILFVFSQKELVGGFMRERFNPMVRDNAWLREKIRERTDSHKNKKVDATLYKSFHGGFLATAWARSPETLSSRPLPKVLYDEADDYPMSSGKKGDIFDLGDNRTVNFSRRKKIRTSSPGIKGYSLIYPALSSSDLRRYYVPCPSCGHMQVLSWDQMRYAEKKPELSFYECRNEKCKEHLKEDAKMPMLIGGEWVKEQPEIKDKAGFHLPKLYSPRISWEKMVDDKLKADREAQQGNREKAKVFYTTGLAELFDPNFSHGDADALKNRIEIYFTKENPILPEGVIYLTFGTDVQDNRLETVVKGWGLGKESWFIEQRIMYGNPATIELWNELDIYLQTPFPHPWLKDSPGLLISAGCIDTAGHHTQEASEFIKGKEYRFIYGYKGARESGKPIAPENPTYNNKYGIPLYVCGSISAKDTIFGRLKIEPPKPYEPTPGLIHLNQRCDDEYINQLAKSEKPVNTPTGRRYEPISNVRNEALDCEVLNLCAIEINRPALASIHDYMIKIRDNVKEIEQTNNHAASNRKSFVNKWRD